MPRSQPSWLPPHSKRGICQDLISKQNRSVGESLRGGFCVPKAAQQGRKKAFLPKTV